MLDIVQNKTEKLASYQFLVLKKSKKNEVVFI